MSEIVLHQLSFAYGETPVFKLLNLRFAEGEIYGLTGRSGLGKTTLLRLLAGLEKPQSGEIQGLEGKRVALLFQEDRLCLNLNALTNVRMVMPEAKDHQMRVEQEESIRRTLLELGLQDQLHQPVRNFSGGMRRRVALARALLAETELLLLDEPFQGLDPESRASAIEAIKKLRGGRSCLVVSHDEDDYTALGAKVIYLEDAQN
jgi:NitT/TauT family transport system ATP-binding protein